MLCVFALINDCLYSFNAGRDPEFILGQHIKCVAIKTQHIMSNKLTVGNAKVINRWFDVSARCSHSLYLTWFASVSSVASWMCPAARAHHPIPPPHHPTPPPPPPPAVAPFFWADASAPRVMAWWCTGLPKWFSAQERTLPSPLPQARTSNVVICNLLLRLQT